LGVPPKKGKKERVQGEEGCRRNSIMDAYPLGSLSRNPGTVMIPQCRFNKTKQDTHPDCRDTTVFATQDRKKETCEHPLQVVENTYQSTNIVNETWRVGVETQENKKILVPLSKNDQNKKPHEVDVGICFSITGTRFLYYISLSTIIYWNKSNQKMGSKLKK